MINELIFFLSIAFIAASTLFALHMSTLALSALVCLEVVLMNLFVTKEIVLFGLHATSSDALGVGAVLGINLLREYCGRESARNTIYVSFALMVFYTISSLILLAYSPASTDTQHAHFAAILSPMPRIMGASLITYFVIELLEYYLYDWLKTAAQSRFVVARNYGVLFTTQFLDTVMFSVLGLWAVVEHLGDVIMVSYTIQMITVLFATPVIFWGARFLNLREPSC